MRMISFKVRAVKPQENMVETFFAFFLLILVAYLLFGIQVWIQLFQGHHVTSPGLLYEPIVEWFMSHKT